MKERLSEVPILAYPHFKIPFVLQVDMAKEGLGAALTQRSDGKEAVIPYVSHLISKGKQVYSTRKRMSGSCVGHEEVEVTYLECYRFIVLTDHAALKWLINLQQHLGRLGRWILELYQHNFDIGYRNRA